MTSIQIRAAKTLVVASLLFVAPEALAATIGNAVAGVNRISGTLAPYEQEISIPLGATDYETPTANVAAFLPPVGTLQARARASVGLDVPNGALFGTIAAFGRAELPGVAAPAVARSNVRFQEVFEVRSDTLPAGALVDVHFELMLTYLASAGATGVGTCCGVSSRYGFGLSASVVGDSSYDSIPSVGQDGVLAGNVGDEFALHFGPYVAEAAVGLPFAVNVFFGIDELALANGVNVLGRNHAGQAEAAASAVLTFASEVIPSDAGFAAADALDPSGGGGAGTGYLYHPTSGFRLPGLEALDSENIHAHLSPLVFVPEPSTILLAMALTCHANFMPPAQYLTRVRKGPRPHVPPRRPRPTHEHRHPIRRQPRHGPRRHLFLATQPLHPLGHPRRHLLLVLRHLLRHHASTQRTKMIGSH